jgi:hypothetical protein
MPVVYTCDQAETFVNSALRTKWPKVVGKTETNFYEVVAVLTLLCGTESRTVQARGRTESDEMIL